MVALLAATPASSQARIKQRFDDIYTMALNGGTRAENIEAAGVNTMIGSVRTSSQAKCQSSYQPAREAISQAAAVSATTALGFLNSRDKVSKRLLKVLDEKHEWYTKPVQDLKVVRRGLLEFRKGFVQSRVAYSYLATAFDVVSKQDCAVATLEQQITGAQNEQSAGARSMSHGLKVLRSLL